MSQSRRDFMKSCALPLAAAVLFPRMAPAQNTRPQGVPMQGPIFNQDDSEFFASRAPKDVAPEAVDAWVDGLVRAGVGTLITCVCAMKTNYASKVWEPRWSRYDPSGPDDQPVLKHFTTDRIPGLRRWLESEKRLADLGVNFHARALARCRTHGVGGWVSIRMNDLHDCDKEDSPLLSQFYLDQRRRNLVRVPYRAASWPDRALDWEREEVREHYMKLVRELLADLDPDGLELDWMRFGYHFRPGRELAGGKILTEWLREVRRECGKAAQRLGHPVKLGARVPSRPDTARHLGLDGAAWAKEGLVDLLTPTPFWATCEFDMPMKTWRRLLDGTATTLAGGIEARYQPAPGGKAQMMTAELAAGAAMAALTGGADCVYLFNYFAGGHGLDKLWGPGKHAALLRAMREAGTLAALPRRHAVTYRDVRAPGEAADNALPASGRVCAFRLQTGPRPEGRPVELLVELEGAEEKEPPVARVNSVLCPTVGTAQKQVFTWPVPAEALADEAHVVEIEAGARKGMKIVRVEFAVGT